jgi:hypothetical protein
MSAPLTVQLLCPALRPINVTARGKKGQVEFEFFFIIGILTQILKISAPKQSLVEVSWQAGVPSVIPTCAVDVSGFELFRDGIKVWPATNSFLADPIVKVKEVRLRC